MAGPDDTSPENLVLRMLQTMRAERAADMRAIADAVGRVTRSQEGVTRALDLLDDIRTDLAAFRAEMTAFRGDTDRSFRRLEADVATLEGRGWDRQAESIELEARLVAVEAELVGLRAKVDL